LGNGHGTSAEYKQTERKKKKETRLHFVRGCSRHRK